MPELMQAERIDPYHPGERLAQERVGVRTRMAARGGAAIRDWMPDQHRSFFATLPFLLIAATDHFGWPAGSVLEGPPGFISSSNPRSLRIAARLDEAGDPVASHLVEGAGVGMLGIDLATRRRNRANGRITRINHDSVDIEVEQSFGNCAQYIQRREIVPVEAVGTPAAPEPLAGIDADATRLIVASDTFFVASSAGDAVDMSHRGGRPSFVRVDSDVLTIPDFAGNRYFNTLGNFLISPRAGLMFIDFARGDLLHLSGKVEIVWDSEEAHQFAGAERLWRVRVSHGWRQRGALRLRWVFRDYAPTTERTGTWDVARRAEGPLSTDADVLSGQSTSAAPASVPTTRQSRGHARLWRRPQLSHP